MTFRQWLDEYCKRDIPKRTFDGFWRKEMEDAWNAGREALLSEQKALNVNLEKPPIGLMPKSIHLEKRFYEVCGAITRYYSVGGKIPIEWVEEYNELLEKVDNDKID